VTATRPATAPQPSAARPGFTLVELLAVIMIIAVLAALLTPAVMRARTAARNAAIKAEIDMLHMAMMNYKNEYGSFPPCFAMGMPPSADPAVRHLMRLFPRMNAGNAQAQFKALSNLNTGTEAGGPITPENALCRWLYGYTDDPTLPVAPGQRKKLYDFDQSRITTPNQQYHPAGKKGSPYVYIDSSQYLDPSKPGMAKVFNVQYSAHRQPDATGNFQAPSQPFLNPDTFQILCAGLDETFGTDDDLSNCWPGTRKEYLDSLK